MVEGADAALSQGQQRREYIERVEQRLSLEKQDLKSKIQEVRNQFRDIAKRKLVLKDEWKKLKIAQGAIRDDAERFERSRRSAWFQAALLPTQEMKRVRFNVSGQLFECSIATLKKDPESMLAAIASEHAPEPIASKNGLIYLDRDWWLFRHIIEFLRHGKLPSDKNLLNSLYSEAGFFKLEVLRDAIRSYLDPNRLVERSCTVSSAQVREFSSSVLNELDEKKPTIDILPKEHLFGLHKIASTVKKDYGTLPEDAWWTSDTYKGKDYSGRSDIYEKQANNSAGFSLHPNNPPVLNINQRDIYQTSNPSLSKAWKEFEDI